MSKLLECFDELFYEMLLDENVNFRLNLTAELFRLKEDFCSIMMDPVEIKALSKRTAEFLRFNNAPITPQLLEIEMEAKVLEKVLRK